MAQGLGRCRVGFRVSGDTPGACNQPPTRVRIHTRSHARPPPHLSLRPAGWPLPCTTSCGPGLLAGGWNQVGGGPGSGSSSSGSGSDSGRALGLQGTPQILHPSSPPFSRLHAPRRPSSRTAARTTPDSSLEPPARVGELQGLPTAASGLRAPVALAQEAPRRAFPAPVPPQATSPRPPTRRAQSPDPAAATSPGSQPPPGAPQGAPNPLTPPKK